MADDFSAFTKPSEGSSGDSVSGKPDQEQFAPEGGIVNTLEGDEVIVVDRPVGPIKVRLDPQRIKLTSTGSTTDRLLADRWADVFNVKDFGATAGGVADDLSSITQTVDLVKASVGGVVYFPSGVYRVTDTIDATDALGALVIRGDGPGNTLLFGDFTGPSKAVLDISFTTNAQRVNDIIVEDLSICANGVIGDPIGLLALRSQQQHFNRLHFAGDGSFLVGATRKLWNCGLIATQINNSDFNDINVFSGFQPVAYSIGSTVRFSGSSGGTTLTATEAVFTSAMAGEIVVLSNGGGSTDASDFFWATISSFTDSTNVELDTTFGETFSGASGSVGFVTGSMSASGTTLTLDQPVATSAMVGMRIHVPLAHTKTDAGSTEGLLCTSIASFTSTTLLELAHSADVTISSLPIVFAPAVFIGKLREEQSDSRQTNDCTINQMQIEGYQGAGLIVNEAIGLYFNELKLHASGEEGEFNKSMFPMIASEIKNVMIDGVQMSFPRHPTYGFCWMMGSRGQLHMRQFECWALLKDAPVVYLDPQNTSSARVQLGPGWFTDGVAKHSAHWRPWFTDTEFKIIQAGPIPYRNWTTSDQVISPNLLVGGASSNDGGGRSIADDAVFKIKPPNAVGILCLASSRAGVTGLVHFRTSDSSAGVLATIIAASTEIEVTTGDLTGTTGTDGKFTISPGATDGAIHLENRESVTVKVSWLFIALGKD